MNILTILDDIYDRVDTENTKKEMQLFDKTLDEFESICSFNVNLFDNSINTVIYYKNEAYIGKKNLNTLYRILIKNGYLVESDISYIINLLCNILFLVSLGTEIVDTNWSLWGWFPLEKCAFK